MAIKVCFSVVFGFMTQKKHSDFIAEGKEKPAIHCNVV